MKHRHLLRGHAQGVAVGVRVLSLAPIVVLGEQGDPGHVVPGAHVLRAEARGLVFPAVHGAPVVHPSEDPPELGELLIPQAFRGQGLRERVPVLRRHATDLLP
ncbi:hypothetical protein JCM30394_15060 [Deferrisoma palaeochoriense]